MAGEKTTFRTDQQRTYYNTTAYWNDAENRNIVPEKYAYVVYSDAWQRTENGQTVNIPAVKIGDGVTRVIDLPFLGEYESQVIADLVHEASDRHFVYEWSQPATCLTVAHNLNKNPSVTVVDTAGSEIVCDVRYDDDNTVTLTFSAPLRGTAYFN